MIKLTSRLTFTACIAALALVACDDARTSNKMPRVQTEVVSYNVAFTKNKSKLSTTEVSSLDAFIQSVPVSAVTFVSLAAEEDEPRTDARAAAISSYLVQHGISRNLIHIQPVVSDVQVPDVIQVTLEYAKVVPVAGCPDWSDNPLVDFNNKRFSNFGCAMNNDTMMQMANPADYNNGHGAATITANRDSTYILNYIDGVAAPGASTGATSVGASSSTFSSR